MELNQSVITNKGRDLMNKVLSGRATITFTSISISSAVYQTNVLATLTSLSDIKQSAACQAKPNDSTTVSVEAAFNNAGLRQGYEVNTIGVYANDPDVGNILYAVATAKQNGYIPADNGISKTGLTIAFYTDVGNASQVNLTVEPSAVATKLDIKNLQSKMDNLQDYIGYKDSDIYGVEIDMVNMTFKRLAGSVGKSGGADFDNVKAFGGRRRCNLAPDGEVLAYYGDSNYTESGFTTADIVKNGITYKAGTKVQVMVEQPKFYYKVVPLELEPIENGRGYSMTKGRYYISDYPKAGFKVHPAFNMMGAEVDYICLSAYEGSIYDESASAYLLNDEQVADFSTDQLSSVANAKPVSGLTQNLTRANARRLAANRGNGWAQQNIQTVSLTQLLFLIEYAKFNMQDVLGMGATQKTDDGSTNMAEKTGGTASLGNASGAVTNAVTYRGEENPYGNIWTMVDGINVFCSELTYVFINSGGPFFRDDTYSTPYKDTGFTLPQKMGYVSAFGYSQEFDWLFLPTETSGNSSVPVGDYVMPHYFSGSQEWCDVLHGGYWGGAYYRYYGIFAWNVYFIYTFTGRNVSARLVFLGGHLT